jgi:hypothetical protein
MSSLRILCYNGRLVTWTVVSLTAAKFKSLIFALCLRIVLCYEHVHSQSERELIYDWRFSAHPFIFAPSLLRLTTSYFYFQMNACGHSPYATSSLKRGWVCRLQLLLVLASAVILGSESAGLMTIFARLPQLGGPGIRIYIPREQGGPVIPTGTGFPFRRHLLLAGLRWRYSNPPPDWRVHSYVNYFPFIW